MSEENFKLEVTEDLRILRNGFFIGRIQWIEDGKYSCYAFIPEKNQNFNLEEINLIKLNLEKKKNEC